MSEFLPQTSTLEWTLLVASIVLAVVVPLVVEWVRCLRYGLPVLIRLDPDNPRAYDLRKYLIALAQRLDGHPERMRVRIDVRSRDRRCFVLDLGADGRLVVKSDGARDCWIDLRNRWIAEHPVPLRLSPTRVKVLYVTPVDANRFRVSLFPPAVNTIKFELLTLLSSLPLAILLNPLWFVPAALLAATLSILRSR